MIEKLEELSSNSEEEIEVTTVLTDAKENNIEEENIEGEREGKGIEKEVNEEKLEVDKENNEKPEVEKKNGEKPEVEEESGVGEVKEEIVVKEVKVEKEKQRKEIVNKSKRPSKKRK
jgi:hypothetical protein